MGNYPRTLSSILCGLELFNSECQDAIGVRSDGRSPQFNNEEQQKEKNRPHTAEYRCHIAKSWMKLKNSKLGKEINNALVLVPIDVVD